MTFTLPSLVGILNITPDSFSDGGRFFTPAAAVAQAKQLIAEGAALLDVGAESTRPGATPLTAEEEWQRLAPILPSVVALGVPVSIDTRHPETAAKAIAQGVAWVNDVSGFTNPQMIATVKDALQVKLVVMHNLGIPADKAVTLPADCDPVAEVLAWAKARITALEAAGIDRSRLVLDPGIGFGKTAEQSLRLVRNIVAFRSLDVPLYVGHSRKSFLALFTTGDRDKETYAVSVHLALQGVEYLRVHEVAANQQVLTAFAGVYERK